MKKIVLLLSGFIFLIGCAEHGLLTKEDYVQLSDEKIRTVVLYYTPVGMKEEEVVKVVRETFNRVPDKKFVYDNAADVEAINKRPDPAAQIELGDYALVGTLASYGWARNFFLAGEVVSASWVFGKNGALKDVIISRRPDSV